MRALKTIMPGTTESVNPSNSSHRSLKHLEVPLVEETMGKNQASLNAKQAKNKKNRNVQFVTLFLTILLHSSVPI